MLRYFTSQWRIYHGVAYSSMESDHLSCNSGHLDDGPSKIQYIHLEVYWHSLRYSPIPEMKENRVIFCYFQTLCSCRQCRHHHHPSTSSKLPLGIGETGKKGKGLSVFLKAFVSQRLWPFSVSIQDNSS